MASFRSGAFSRSGVADRDSLTKTILKKMDKIKKDGLPGQH